MSHVKRRNLFGFLYFFLKDPSLDELRNLSIADKSNVHTELNLEKGGNYVFQLYFFCFFLEGGLGAVGMAVITM